MKTGTANCELRVVRSSLIALAAAGMAFAMMACAGKVDTHGGDGTVGVAASALTVESVGSTAQSQQDIQQSLPTARVHSRAGRVVRLYGKSMSTGSSPEAASEDFRVKAAEVLGAVADELRALSDDGAKSFSAAGPRPIGLMLDKTTGKYKFYLYRYAQARDDIRVYESELLTLVKNEGGNPVVWASSTLRDLKNFTVAAGVTAPKIDNADALAAIGAYADSKGEETPIPRAFSRFSQPDLVIFAGAGDEQVSPRLATQYVAENDNPLAKMKFVADAATGEILHSENLRLAANVGGTVNGKATVGPRAWNSLDANCASTASTAFPYADVSITGGSSGFTSSTGYFYLSNAGTSPVTVLSPVTGQYFDVVDLSTANEQLSLTVVPPNSAHFMHNQSDTQEYIRAQANGYVHANRVRDFLMDYLPGFPGISTQSRYPVKVNSSNSACPNAWWGGSGGIEFCRQTGSAKNAAFGAIIYYEFGHNIVNQGGSGQGEYGEGMADTISVLVDEVPGYGYGWGTNPCDTPDRWADNTCQYAASPNCSDCGSEIHACGQLLSGIIWDIRLQLMATHPSDYRDIINALTFSSIPMHTGTAIDGSIAVDFLNLDDDDGNLGNGTPHHTEICAGFALHGIDCPTMPNANPCSSYCANPLVFSWSGSYQSGPLGTGLVCRETTQPIQGGNCGNLTGGRSLFVNGTAMTCNNQNWSSIPAAVNGGHCITTTAGDYSWAFFTLW